MYRTCWLVVLLPVVLAASRLCAASSPNVILVMADDVGIDAIGCYGGESYPTPVLDRFAASGMRFRHCYSMPSCHPTRITLLTGRYPRRLGNPRWGSFPEAEATRTVAAVLADGGYATAVAGKWQLSLLGKDLTQPNRMGFGEYSLFGWHEGPRYYQPLIWQDGKKRLDVAERYGPDVYCDFLIDFMKRHRDGPFFAYFPMALCHDVTDDLQDPVPYGPRGRYDTYAEMMAEMDRVFGRLVEAVDELGLRDNTLILFTTDNGTAARSIVRAEGGKYIRDPVYSVYRGRRIQGGKTRLTDGGTRVPLLVRWPGVIEKGRVVDDLVDFTDFLPTLAELTGCPLPVGVSLDGHSFADRLRANRPSPRRWAYAEAKGKYFVRTQRWKLYDDGRLFDVEADPTESNALSAREPPAEAAGDIMTLQTGLRQVARLGR